MNFDSFIRNTGSGWVVDGDTAIKLNPMCLNLLLFTNYTLNLLFEIYIFCYWSVLLIFVLIIYIYISHKCSVKWIILQIRSNGDRNFNRTSKIKSKKSLLKIKTREMIPAWQTVVLLITKLNVKKVNIPMSLSDLSNHIILLVGGGWQWRNKGAVSEGRG